MKKLSVLLEEIENMGAEELKVLTEECLKLSRDVSGISTISNLSGYRLDMMNKIASAVGNRVIILRRDDTINRILE